MPSFRTLNPKKHHVILAGDFTTYGSVNAVGGLTYTAAVYGPASGTFDVINAGVISTYSPQASNTVSAGLLLASPGTVNNLGTISALEGVAVLLQSKAPGDRVVNRGDLYGYAGIQLNGAGTVSNFGSINGGQAGIALIAGGQVDNRGTILSRYGDGIYEYDAPFTTTIYNAGQILGHTAVYLVGQSTVQNRATGTISGTVYGLDLLSVSAVYNQGTIYGARNAVWLRTGGSISNTGTLLGGYGIDTSGGLAYVTNSGYIRTQNTGIIASDGGTISNFGTITGGQGIAIQDPFQLASTVFNNGVITATEDFGVYLISPATLINSGTISGPSNVVNFGGGGELVNYDNISGGMVGVTNESGLLQAYNFGTIVATGNAIQSYNGGHVSNQGFIAGGQGITGAGQGIALVNAPAYVYNRGTILGTNGIFFNTGGGYVVNQKSGIILATGTGITLTGGGWIKNLGDISGGAGINIVGIGTVNNFGTITGSTNDGLRIYSTGTASADVQNFLGSFGGIITSTAANGIEISASYGFMLNSGTISGGENGVVLHGHGEVSNDIGGKILGGEYGVVLGPAANGYPSTASLFNWGFIYGNYGGVLAAGGATISNYGTIGTGGAYAIQFNGYYNNRLIINAGASFQGAVYGGNGALELADDGATIGTFSAAEQSTFTGFNSFQIDAAATWDLAGSFTFNSAPTLVNNGIIKESATDTLTVNAAVAGSGTIVMFNEPITFKGAVASTQNILFTGIGEELALADSVAFKGKIEKFAAHDEIFLTNVSLSQITATHFIAGVLTLSEAATKLEFTFANPASFGNETFKVSAQGHGTAISLVNAAASDISGAVNGGNGILELAADGSAIGTVTTAEQAQFANFNSLQIDPGAVWDFAGNFTIAGPNLLNNGTIKESASDKLTIENALTGTGAVDLSKKPLTLNGSVASTQKISFSGTGEVLALGDPKKFGAKIEKFALGDTIDLTSISLSAITATHFTAGVLTLAEGSTKLLFTFASPASFGTDTFALTAAGHGTEITLAPAALLPVTPPATLTALPTFA